MHIVSGLLLRDCDQLLFSLCFLIDLMVQDYHTTKSQGKLVTKSVPMDARTVVQRLALKPSYKAFICCPECSTCYPNNGLDPCPELCTSRRLSTQQICGQHLRKPCNIHGHSHDIPVRPFLYHDFKEWLGEMLCRPGMENMMDRSFSPSPDGIMGDIWDAPGVYKIPGPNGHPFIHRCPDNEGHYLFSFNMDGFNPFQLKQAGRSATVMGLYMVCLNLPPEVCFKSENMFLAGIIPGPKEPSTDEINNFLWPLVNDLLESYETGVYYCYDPGLPTPYFSSFSSTTSSYMPFPSSPVPSLISPNIPLGFPFIFHMTPLFALFQIIPLPFTFLGLPASSSTCQLITYYLGRLLSPFKVVPLISWPTRGCQHPYDLFIP